MLAGQQAACKRTPHENAEPLIERDGREFVFGFARFERVVDLLADETRQTVTFAHVQRLHQVPARIVRTADIPDLAVPHEQIERFERFLERREAVPLVDLVQVDHVRLEPPQARLASLDQMMPRQAAIVRTLAHREAGLCRDQHAALALAAKRLADDFLGRAVRIDVRRIDQIDARVDAHVDLPARFVEADLADLREFSLAAHCHGAQRDGRHFEA